MKKIILAVMIMTTFTASAQHLPDNNPEVQYGSLSIAQRICAAKPGTRVYLMVRGEWILVPCSTVIDITKGHEVVDYFDDVVARQAKIREIVKDALRNSRTK